MTLDTAEFIRRFLAHVLPKGFHRIRHYGLFASNVRTGNLATMRALIAFSSLLPQVNETSKSQTSREEAERCPKCGGRMHIILRFEGACRRRKTAPVPARFDTS